MGDITDWMHESGMLDMPDPFDYGDAEWGGRPGRERNAPACKPCGSIDVHWRETEHGWRLFNDKRQHPGNRYVEHDCTPEPTADGFEGEPT